RDPPHRRSESMYLTRETWTSTRRPSVHANCAMHQRQSRLCHGNSVEHASRAKSGLASCRRDRIAPLCSSFGSEYPRGGSGDEVALKVEGVVNRAVHAEEALGGSS